MMGTYRKHHKPKTRPVQDWTNELSDLARDLYFQIYVRAVCQAERVGAYNIAAAYADAASRLPSPFGNGYSGGLNGIFAGRAVRNYERAGLQEEADRLRAILEKNGSG